MKCTRSDGNVSQTYGARSNDEIWYTWIYKFQGLVRSVRSFFSELYLYQFHNWYGVEEMQTTEPIFSFRASGYLSNGEAGCVTGEQS